MAYSEQEIIGFETLVRQLLGKYKKLRSELADVKLHIAAQEKKVADMENLANASMHDYDMLKMAKMLEVSDGDIAATRKRINRLIQDVDKCITLLNEQNQKNQVKS